MAPGQVLHKGVLVYYGHYSSSLLLWVLQVPMVLMPWRMYCWLWNWLNQQWHQCYSNCCSHHLALKCWNLTEKIRTWLEQIVTKVKKLKSQCCSTLCFSIQHSWIATCENSVWWTVCDEVHRHQSVHIQACWVEHVNAQRLCYLHMNFRCLADCSFYYFSVLLCMPNIAAINSDLCLMFG